MARRSDHNRDELYDMALSAAGLIVRQDGFHSLTARNVAERIGYSVGTLYNIFKNLDDLILHLNGQTLTVLGEKLGAVAISGKPEADVNAMLHVYLGFVEDQRPLWEMLFLHRLPAGQKAPDWYYGKVATVLGPLEEALAPIFLLDQRGEARQAARVLWASLHGIQTLALDGKLDLVSGDSVRALAESLVDNYLTGLRVRMGRV